MSISGKKIMIFGGSGSLGNQIIKTYIEENIITNYSRDECKHWKMELRYRTDRLSHIIGDIRDYNRVETSIIREQPNIIIIASALKHVDRCEFSIDECVKTNFMGPMNVLRAIETNIDRIKSLECAVFISTDKACEPTNVYGLTKSLAESAMIEKSLHIKECKFVNVRYGNVLNSRGSILPILHKIGKDPNASHFTLTHPDMTRFVMTLQQSVALIEHAVLKAESGDTVIPQLISMRLIDLLKIFSQLYDKPVVVTKIRPGEKMLESLISETQSRRLIKGEDGYRYIKPCYCDILVEDDVMNYNSRMNPLDKASLYDYLNRLSLL